jgi:hypothetical protein
MSFRPTTPSLGRYTFGFVLLSATLAIVVGLLIVQQRLQEQHRAALAEAVATRAQGAVLDYSRRLHEDWRSVQALARQAADTRPEDLRRSLDAVIGDGTRVSWAGYAASDGTVLAASNGLLEGRDVSERPWFRFGLEGNFAGDVHEALLLANLLPPTETGEPRRFLDLAAPVVGSDGTARGVVGFHIDFDWARRHLAETAGALQIDVFLLNAQGQVVIASDGRDYPPLDMASVRAAATGAPSVSFETWPDGEAYFTTVLPTVAYEDLPSFGWRLVARIDGNAVDTGARRLTVDLAFVLVAFAVVLIVATAMFVNFFIRPFGRIADNALSIADGGSSYPPEIRRTAETEKLSAALARIQSRLAS